MSKDQKKDEETRSSEVRVFNPKESRVRHREKRKDRSESLEDVKVRY